MSNALPLQSFLALLGSGVGSLGVCARMVSPGELPEVVDQQGEKGHNLYPITTFSRGIFTASWWGVFHYPAKPSLTTLNEA